MHEEEGQQNQQKRTTNKDVCVYNCGEINFVKISKPFSAVVFASVASGFSTKVNQCLVASSAVLKFVPLVLK